MHHPFERAHVFHPSSIHHMKWIVIALNLALNFFMKRFLYISINYTMLNPFWGPRISLISIYNMLYFEFRLGPQYWFGSQFKQFRILTTYTSSGINIGLTGAGFFENILRHKLYRFVIVFLLFEKGFHLYFNDYEFPYNMDPLHRGWLYMAQCI